MGVSVVPGMVPVLMFQLVILRTFPGWIIYLVMMLGLKVMISLYELTKRSATHKTLYYNDICINY